jgi:hypothetical protein
VTEWQDRFIRLPSKTEQEILSGDDDNGTWNWS